jgi:hypothetical protein
MSNTEPEDLDDTTEWPEPSPEPEEEPSHPPIELPEE